MLGTGGAYKESGACWREAGIMRQKVFTRPIRSMADMALLETTIGGLLGGEHSKCSLVRTNEFVQLRLCALYDRGAPPLHVYGEGLQISLDVDNVASVYLLISSIEPDDVVLLGKRPASVEPDDPAEPETP